jgi:hypothetical protein
MKVSNLTPTDNAVSFTDAKDSNITDEITELNSDGKSLTFTLSPTSPVVTSKTGNDIYIKIGAFNSPWSDPLKFTISTSDVKETPVLSPTPTLSSTPTPTLTPSLTPKTTDSIIAVPLVKTTNTSDLNPAQYIPSTVTVDNGSKFSVNVRLLGKTQKATISAQCPTNTSLVEEVAYKQSSNIQSVPLCGTSADILPIPSQALIFNSQNQTIDTQNIILTLTQTDAEGQSTKSTSRISIKPGPKPIKTVAPTVTPNATPSATPSVSPTQSTTQSPSTSVKPSTTVSPTTTTLPPAPALTTVSAPTVSLTSNTPSVTLGSPATLSWSSNGAVSCTSSWAGTVSTSGSNNVYPSNTTTYSLYCTNSAGVSTKTTTVYVYNLVQSSTPLPIVTSTPASTASVAPAATTPTAAPSATTNASATPTSTPIASASLPVFRATLWDAIKLLFGF